MDEMAKSTKGKYYIYIQRKLLCRMIATNIKMICN